MCGVPAGALIGDLFGWRAAFFGGAALAVGVLLAQLRLLTSVPPSRPVTPRDLVLPLRLPMARIGLIAIVLLFIGHFAAYTYLRPLLQQVFVLSPSAISLQLLAYGAIGLLGTGPSWEMMEGCDTLLMIGCSTSGCIRASAVDAVQHGFRAMVVRECVGDRHPGPHEANLFDIDSKYGDVVHKREALDYLNRL